jgi:malate dehydrogenase (oxaloacetate-decarboxylating)
LSLVHPSASFSATIRVRLEDHPGTFAKLATAIGDAGGSLGAIDVVRVERNQKVRDVTVMAEDDHHLERIVDAVRAVGGIEVEAVSDRTFLMHLGGKVEVTPRHPLKTRDDLSMAYTPGVGRVSKAIQEDPEKIWSLTVKRNMVAVVSDGTAVLGLGDIGPGAALPVMEGKAVLFKEFAGVDAFPICLDTTDPDEIVEVVAAIAPVFGGINLEDISAPRCFVIEERLKERLDIPVFHDDKRIEDVRIVMTGVGAAGIAVARVLLAAGARDVVGCDSRGAVYRGRDHLNAAKEAFAEITNGDSRRGSADALLEGADVFIGLSQPGAISVEGVRRMADRAIVFALANPIPEVFPEDVAGLAEVVATGRSDYPNQINNVLAFPGIFRGALDVRARDIDESMKVAAAHAIASTIADDELSADYVVPSVFNRSVAPAVAAAVAAAAEQSGLARRRAPAQQPA